MPQKAEVLLQPIQRIMKKRQNKLYVKFSQILFFIEVFFNFWQCQLYLLLF